jgi:hypothetical protein
MKRFNRRQFLKTAGAAAGAALLGQGCAPSATPTGLDVLLEDADIQIDGDKVKIPECCVYTGKYHIDNPPKRPIYGTWAQEFIGVIKLLNDPNKNNFPNTDENFIKGVSDCLGFAVDKLFQGDVHSARNGLAVVAYMLMNIEKIELWLKAKKGMPSDPKEWLIINYYNTANHEDIWDMLSFAPADPVKADPSQPAGSAAMRTIGNNLNQQYPLLSEWLGELVPLADKLNLRAIFGKEVEDNQTEFTAIWNDFNNALKKCPKGYDCESFEISPDPIPGQLSEMGISYQGAPTFPIVMLSLWDACNDKSASISDMIDNPQSTATDEDCEAALEEFHKLLRLMINVVLEFARKVDEAQQEAEAYALAREKAANTDMSIWELIPFCLKHATVDRFMNSLDDWWGAKKYIVGVGCAIVHVPIIVASAGLAVIPAIYDFVVCFLEGMVGDALDVVEDFGTCVVENW